jgi:hypothetical protein
MIFYLAFLFLDRVFSQACAYNGQIAVQIQQLQQQAQMQMQQLQNQAAYATPEAAQQLVVQINQINQNMATTIQQLQSQQLNNCYITSSFGIYPYGYYTSGLYSNYWANQQYVYQLQALAQGQYYQPGTAASYVNQMALYNQQLIQQAQAIQSSW